MESNGKYGIVKVFVIYRIPYTLYRISYIVYRISYIIYEYYIYDIKI
jgi:hypothetical protein